MFVINDCETLEEILRIPEDPAAPAGIVILPVTELEFPVIVMVVVPNPDDVMFKRQAEDSGEIREQATLLPDWGRIV